MDTSSYGTSGATSPAKKQFIASAASKSYAGPSIVDFLNKSGYDSSIGSRDQLASQYGIQNYKSGTAESNLALMAALRGATPPSGTPPTTTPTGTGTPTDTSVSTAPKASSPYETYLQSLFDPEALKTANANVADLNKRSAEELARARFTEEQLRKNEVGQLVAGQNAGLSENARLSNKSLADIAIAKGASTDVVNQILNAGKDLYAINKDKVSANAPFELSPGQERYTYNSSTGKYEKTASAAPALRSVSQGTTLYDPVTNEPLYTAPKTYAPKGTTPTTIKNDIIAKGEQELNAAKGPDGWTDPYLYKEAYDSWIADKMGTTAQFLTKFPPKNYVNPKATFLPSYLQNKTKTSTRSL